MEKPKRTNAEKLREELSTVMASLEYCASLTTDEERLKKIRAAFSNTESAKIGLR